MRSENATFLIDLWDAVWQPALDRWEFRSNLAPATVAEAEEWWPQKLDTNTVWISRHSLRLFNLSETGFQLGLGALTELERVKLSLSLWGEDGTDYMTGLDLGDGWPERDIEEGIAWTCKSLAPIRDGGTIDLDPVRKAAEDALAAVAAHVRS